MSLAILAKVFDNGKVLILNAQQIVDALPGVGKVKDISAYADLADWISNESPDDPDDIQAGGIVVEQGGNAYIYDGGGATPGVVEVDDFKPINLDNNKADKDGSNITNAATWTAFFNEFTESNKGLVPAPGSALGRKLKDTGWDDPDLGAHEIPPDGGEAIVRANNDATFIFINEGKAYIGAGSAALKELTTGISIIYEVPDSPRIHMDVEVTLTDDTVLSLITGNSDRVGLNGLPVIQEALQPTMGAYPLYLTSGRVL